MQPRDPGPPPLEPTLPREALLRLRAELEHLIDAVARTRNHHDAAADSYAGPQRFVGAAADDFRYHLVGQLRRSLSLQDHLVGDLAEVDRMLAAAAVMQDRYEEERRSWQQRQQAWHAHLYREGYCSTVDGRRVEPALLGRIGERADAIPRAIR